MVNIEKKHNNLPTSNLSPSFPIFVPTLLPIFMVNLPPLPSSGPRNPTGHRPPKIGH